MKKKKTVKALKTRNTTRKVKFDRRISYLIGILHTIAVVGLLFAIYRLKMLPVKFVIPAVIVIFISLGLVLLWLFRSKGYGAKIITMIITVAILFSVPKLTTFAKFVANVTGASKDVHVVEVLVKKESKYESISDLKDYTGYVGGNTLVDSANVLFARDEITRVEKFDISLRDYNQYEKMMKDFYSGEIDVILLSNAHKSLVEEDYPDFEDETRVLKTYTYSTNVDILDRDINVTKDTFSIFVTGIDTSGSVSKVSRSDVNMIVTVNPVTRQILMTSIPRDYYVKLHTEGELDKLTHAGLYGVMESVNTLEDLLSEQASERIEIDYYLRVNFTSVTKIVDALGGVNVDTNFNFTTRDGYKFKKGTNYVNGNAALSFVRERKNVQGGDKTRIIHQQALLTGVINKMLSPAIITNFNQVMSSIGGSFELSMKDNEVNQLLRYQLDKGGNWDIIQIQLDGTGASKVTYSGGKRKLYVMDPDFGTVENAAEMIVKMIHGNEVSRAKDWRYK